MPTWLNGLQPAEFSEPEKSARQFVRHTGGTEGFPLPVYLRLAVYGRIFRRKVDSIGTWIQSRKRDHWLLKIKQIGLKKKRGRDISGSKNGPPIIWYVLSHPSGSYVDRKIFGA